MNNAYVKQIVLSYFVLSLIFWSYSLSTTLCRGFLILRIPKNMGFKTARAQNSVIGDDIVMIVMSKHLIKTVLSYFGVYLGLLGALCRCLDAVTTQTKFEFYQNNLCDTKSFIIYHILFSLASGSCHLLFLSLKIATFERIVRSLMC